MLQPHETKKVSSLLEKWQWQAALTNPTYISLLPAVETHQGSGTLRVPNGALPKALCWKRGYNLTVEMHCEWSFTASCLASWIWTLTVRHQLVSLILFFFFFQPNLRLIRHLCPSVSCTQTGHSLSDRSVNTPPHRTGKKSSHTPKTHIRFINPVGTTSNQWSSLKCIFFLIFYILFCRLYNSWT